MRIAAVHNLYSSGNKRQLDSTILARLKIGMEGNRNDIFTLFLTYVQERKSGRQGCL